MHGPARPPARVKVPRSAEILLACVCASEKKARAFSGEPLGRADWSHRDAAVRWEGVGAPHVGGRRCPRRVRRHAQAALGGVGRPRQARQVGDRAPRGGIRPNRRRRRIEQRRARRCRRRRAARRRARGTVGATHAGGFPRTHTAPAATTAVLPRRPTRAVARAKARRERPAGHHPFGRVQRGVPLSPARAVLARRRRPRGARQARPPEDVLRDHPTCFDPNKLRISVVDKRRGL